MPTPRASDDDQPARRPEPEFRDEPGGLETHNLVAASIGSAIGALITSRFGIAGTLIGASLAPVFVMVSVQALGPHIQRGVRRSRSSLTRGFETLQPTERRGWRWALRHPIAFGRRIRRLTRRQVGLALAASALAFGIALIALTAVESLIGKPIASVGRHGPSGGTTLSPHSEPRAPAPPANATPEITPGGPGTGGKPAPSATTPTVPDGGQTVPTVPTQTQPPTTVPTTTAPAQPGSPAAPTP